MVGRSMIECLDLHGYWRLGSGWFRDVKAGLRGACLVLVGVVVLTTFSIYPRPYRFVAFSCFGLKIPCDSCLYNLLP